MSCHWGFKYFCFCLVMYFSRWRGRLVALLASVLQIFIHFVRASSCQHPSGLEGSAFESVFIVDRAG